LLEKCDCIDDKLDESKGVKDLQALQKRITLKCGFFEDYGDQLSCETIGKINRDDFHKDLETCYMEEKTSIPKTGVKFSDTREDSIQGLIFNSNKNIFYLPERTGKKFVSLLFYEAVDCSISSISKVNFDGLKNLKRLNLERNTIQKISSDTFSELARLEILILSKF
jgi:Leucine rich repeat